MNDYLIERHLMKNGIQKNWKGFNYLKSAIQLCWEDPYKYERKMYLELSTEIAHIYKSKSKTIWDSMYRALTNAVVKEKSVPEFIINSVLYLKGSYNG